MDDSHRSRSVDPSLADIRAGVRRATSQNLRARRQLDRLKRRVIESQERIAESDRLVRRLAEMLSGADSE